MGGSRNYSAANCAPHTDETVREYFDDVGITGRVKAAIAGEGVLALGDQTNMAFMGTTVTYGYLPRKMRFNDGDDVTQADAH